MLASLREEFPELTGRAGDTGNVGLREKMEKHEHECMRTCDAVSDLGCGG